MKYCNNCGKEVSDNAVVCPFCGCAVASKNVEVDKPSTGLNVLSFLIPLVGLILYLSWQNSTPIKAKAVGKWAPDWILRGSRSEHPWHHPFRRTDFQCYRSLLLRVKGEKGKPSPLFFV